jgi:hypothetical protein
MYVKDCERPTYCIWDVQNSDCREKELKVSSVLQVTQVEYFARTEVGYAPKPISSGYALHVAATELSPAAFAIVVEDL